MNFECSDFCFCTKMSWYGGVHSQLHPATPLHPFVLLFISPRSMIGLPAYGHTCTQSKLSLHLLKVSPVSHPSRRPGALYMCDMVSSWENRSSEDASQILKEACIILAGNSQVLLFTLCRNSYLIESPSRAL